MTFVGRTGAQNAIERIDGFAEGAGDKFVANDKMADDTNKSVARENVRNAIRNHQGLNVLVGIWSYNAPAIVDVVRELDRRKDFTIVVRVDRQHLDSLLLERTQFIGTLERTG